MKKILFIRSDRFGEFLLSLPAIKLVKINYPQSKVYLLARKDNLKLIEGINFIDCFLEYKKDAFLGYKGAFRLAKILKRERIDCCIILNSKKEFHLASFLGGIPLRVGYDRKWKFCLNKKIKDNKFLADKHEVEYNIDLVSLICKKSFIPHISFPVDERNSIDFLKNDLDIGCKYLVIHPFSSNFFKKIDYEFWSELVRRLKERFEENIVLIGEQNEIEEARILEEKLGVKNLVGKLNLRNLATFLKYNCQSFIGLDSGPMHLANIVGIPVVGLFKASHSKRWRPYWGKYLVVEEKTLGDFLSRMDKIMAFVSGY